MPRTNVGAVQDILGNDYDGVKALTGYIATANVMVTRVNTCAESKGITLSATELELIERWLSAHFYAVSDKPYSSKSTAGASASFHGQTGMGLDATLYGQTAQMVDYSGCLTNIAKNQNVGFGWIGKTEADALTYDERN